MINPTTWKCARCGTKLSSMWILDEATGETSCIACFEKKAVAEDLRAARAVGFAARHGAPLGRGFNLGRQRPLLP